MLSLPLFDKGAGTILVTEGNGVVSYRVAAKLMAAGYPTVRIGVPTDPSTSVEKLRELGAEVVAFDWDKEETFNDALKGVKSVFIAMPHHKNWEAMFTAFLTKAKAAGVKNLCKLSFYHALASKADTMTSFDTATRIDDPFLEIPFVLMHRECDRKIMKTSHMTLNYAILFASHFMSNPIVYQSESLRTEHKFYGASNGKGINYVSPNDVAEVAVRALLAPADHHRVGYTLTGPTTITDHEVAVLLGQRLNAPVTYVDRPLQEYAKTVASGTDWGPSSDVATLEYVKATGFEEVMPISKDVDKVCGHPAETYEEYLLAQDAMSDREIEFLRLGGFVSEVDVSEAHVSEVDVSEVDVSEVDVPKVDVSEVDVPKVDVSESEC